MQAADITQYAKSEIKQSLELYLKDLRALPAEVQSKSPGGSARTPFDISYELIVVNERGAKRLKGEDPGPWPFTGWVTAPEDWKDLEKLAAGLTASVEALTQALGDDPFRMVPMGSQPKAAFQQVLFYSMHIMYHAAQLNLIQAMHGDEAMHWM